MPPSVQQNFILPQGVPQSTQPTNPNLTTPMWALTDEGLKSILKLTDPEFMYLNHITRLLYSSALVKTGAVDSMSPLAGYTLVDIGSKDGQPSKKNINYEGYMTFANNFMLFVTDVHSTTHINEKKHNAELSAVNDTMALIDMLVSNWQHWDFTNDTLVVSLGLAVFEAIYFVRRRSIEGNTLNKIFKVFQGQQVGNTQLQGGDERPKVKYLPL